MKNNIFREYDIRGIVHKELDLEQAYNLGKAIAVYLKSENDNVQSIIVGRDGRTHSPHLCNEIIRSLIDSGINVIDIGLSPTPVLYFAIAHLQNPFGLTVTASHNPKEYNGVKMWGISGEKIQAIKELYFAKKFITASKPGNYARYDANTAYISYITEHFKDLRGATINAIVDCGNGSAGIVFPTIVQKLELKGVQLLYPEVDGNFPHHEADPTVMENMEDVRHALQCDNSLEFGLGFDGDADRMNPMTKEGVLVPGDQMLAVYAQAIQETHAGRAVVFDIKSSGGLIELLESWNALPILSPSGHTNIKQRMKEFGAVLGGELSCHFFFGDRYFGYDDGLYAALRLFEIIHKTGKTLTQLLEIFPPKISSREFRIACKSDEHKKVIIDHVTSVFAARTDVTSTLIDGIRANMPYGWGLARASNTQPVICLRFESSDAAGLLQVKQDFYNALINYFDAEKLKEHIEYT